MKVQINKIRDGQCEIGNMAGQRKIEIEDSDIQAALENYQPEKKSFQADISSLNKDIESAKSLEEAYLISKASHVRRIATIIKEELYRRPILTYKHTTPDKDYLDGGHRVIAARYLGLDEIDAIQVDKVLSDKEKQELWGKITELNDDVMAALESLNITYTF